MKKLLLLFTLLGVAGFCYAQEELPQVVPVSPEAASLGKYGEIPVNLSTGKINYNVPLYTIDVNGFSWPISLSYNYSGLIAEQDPPVTGLGWDLMATGRITRQVRGLPDELSGNLSYKKNTIVPYLESGIDAQSLFNIYSNIANNVFDGQNDKYHINAGGLSGSYIHNEDNTVVFLNHRNYKVDDKIITDENGVIYYFEQSELGDFNVNTPEGGEVVEHIPMSYLLTKIELPNNKGVINFEYYPTITYDKEIVTENEVFSFVFPDGFNTYSVTKSVRYVPLKKISFPSGEVRFNISTALDSGTTTAALEDISVWDYNSNSEILKYNFVYSDSTKRIKTMISINRNDGGTVLPFYSFDYHSFPSSIDYRSQDFWGYYNGKSNANLIDGDREVDFQKTQSGTLKTITYPTKGTTEITYEQNRIVSYASNSNGDCTYSHNKNVIGQLIGDANLQTLDTVIEVPSNQIIKVYAYARVGNGISTNMFGAEASIEIQTIGQACTYNNININKAVYGEEVPCEGNPNCPDYTESDTQFGFTSDAKIYIRGSVEAPQGKLAKIYYRIDYEDRINEDKFIGGVRVAQTNDCSTSLDCITTDYKYVNTDDTSSGNLLGAEAIFFYATHHSQIDVSGNKYHRSTHSLQNFSSYQSSPVLYERVEILKNGGGNGKVVNYYSKFGNQGQVSQGGLTTLPIIQLENNDWKNGKLLKTEIFKKEESGTFTLQKEEENIYNDFFPYGEGANSTLKGYNFDAAVVQYISTSASNPSPTSIYDFNEASTIDYPKAYLQTKSISKEYFANNNMVSEVLNEYDMQTLLLKKQETINSKGEKLISKTYYPADVTSISSLGFSNLSTVEYNAIDRLKKDDLHRIASPLQTETYKDFNSNGIAEASELISARRTNYDEPYTDMLVPKSIQTLKGAYDALNNPLEERIVFESYYDNGNIREVSKKDGTHIVYIWGYNQTSPVAKIENATYSQVAGYVANIQTLSNADNDRTLGTSGNEGALRIALNDLRNIVPNAMITTFTYDPMIGVTSITDPRGNVIYYNYDGFNRLESVKDKDGNILSENQYHYKN